VFRCVRCNQELTRDPALLGVFPERPQPREGEIASATVPVGHYAIDPVPFGAPFVPNDDPRASVPAMANMSLARDGVFLKSAGPRDTLVLHPEDAAGLRDHPGGGRFIGCCGPSGMYGMNQVCGCGAEVATLVADCLMQYELHIHPARVWADTSRTDRTRAS
jgi:hypothetical protein